MKRLALFLLPLLSVFFLYQSVSSYLKIRSRGNELGLLRAQVEGLEGKLNEKQTELDYRKSPDFIYKEALEQLGLTKPGELIAVLPDWAEKEKGAEDGSPTSTSSLTSSRPNEPVPYWKQWRILFFGN
jgi:hypothetical protein